VLELLALPAQELDRLLDHLARLGRVARVLRDLPALLDELLADPVELRGVGLCRLPSALAGAARHEERHREQEDEQERTAHGGPKGTS
jgi:hypothetical protein